MFKEVDGKTVATPVEELKSSQEEADSRLILHTKHMADNGHNTVIIQTSDTDVELLACYHKKDINCRIILVKSGNVRNKYVDINCVEENLDPFLRNALLGLHAFTGCDSTSSFMRKGKLKPLKLITENPSHREAMAQLGNSFEVTNDLHHAMEMFVSDLYGFPGDSVNECRYQVYYKKTRKSSGLPPTKNCLSKHTERANYQTAIWKRALQANPEVPSPVGHGWKSDYGIDWMDMATAPSDLILLRTCACGGDCSNNRCTCRKYKVRCTDTCKCKNCSNSSQLQDELQEIPNENELV